MRLQDIKNDVNPKIYSVLKGIDKFRPCQEKAIKSGVMQGASLLVCSPTASGKTLVAELAALARVLDKKEKCIYIVPLKSLAVEKYGEFKEKYSKINVRTALSIGDLDSNDGWLENYDIIITTSEKLDSLIRHGANWLQSVGTVIVDEIHLLNDSGRGPTLEILLTLLKIILPEIQIVGLSATIGNPKELAEWLSANLVQDDWRPVKLFHGTLLDNELDFFEKKESKNIIAKVSDATLKIALDTIAKGKQALIFCPTKNIAESTATKLAALLSPKISAREMSAKALSCVSPPTSQCRKLADNLSRGIAFHHAGLVQKQKKLIEDNFRDEKISVICCTPTLCLHSKSEIWGNLNRKIVNKMGPGEPIFMLNESNLKLTKVKELNESSAPQNLVRLTSCCGYCIKVTPDHSLLVRRNGKRIELPASEIRKCDKIATVGKMQIVEKDIKWDSFVKDNKLPFVNGALSNDLFYFIGAMLGDGYSGAEIYEQGVKYKGSPVIVGKDTEVFEITKKVCKKYDLHYRECKNYYGINQLILSKSKWFREFLVKCGVGKGADKHINKLLKSAPKDKLAALLQGLFDTDGYVERNRSVGFSNISLNLIKDIQQCLLRWGIVTRVRHRKGGTMQIYGKDYKTKDYYELLIDQRKSVIDFAGNINFKIGRKASALSKVIKRFSKDLLYVSCKNCGYSLSLNVFEGRTSKQKEWAKQRKKVIKLLGKKGELGSREITNLLGFVPRNKERRLNPHYNLISKRRVGSRSKTEWYWKLNALGNWVYNNTILSGAPLKEKFLETGNCPLCNKDVQKELRGTWRKGDFEGDIFWDVVRNVEQVKAEEDKVYDIVLDEPKESFFVANGFLVHNSAGVNLPAFRTIIKSLKRYTGKFGMDWIPVLEYHQMSGRAGRPNEDKDSFGEAITIAKSEDNKQLIYEKYILGLPEDIVSKLAEEWVLRSATLSLISTGFVRTEDNLMKFFKDTLYGHQYKNDWGFSLKVREAIKILINYQFIQQVGLKLEPTTVGKRISELYIDPDSAFKIIQGLKSFTPDSPDFSLLQIISDTPEMSPGISVRRGDFEWIEEELIEKEPEIITHIPKEWDLDRDRFMRAFKLTLLLQDWADERSEQSMLEKFNVRPGEIHTQIKNSEWLLFGCFEIARLMKKMNILSEINRIRYRMKYGIREELMALVKLRGIGRYRARKLYSAGIKNIRDVKRADLSKLKVLLGEKTGASIKNQVTTQATLQT